MRRSGGRRGGGRRRCRRRAKTARARPRAAPPDDARGDADLFALHGLERIARVVLTGGLKPQDYLSAIPGGATEWRKYARGGGAAPPPPLPVRSLADALTASHPPRPHTRTPSVVGAHRGPGLDLAPLADVYPATTKPDWRPLSAEELQRAFTLQPGHYQLPEVRMWVLVRCGW